MTKVEIRAAKRETRKSNKVTEDDRAALARIIAEDVDLGITFAIWQGLMLRATGVYLNRHQFDEATQRWEENPSRWPMMTIAINAEENMSHMIMTTKIRQKPTEPSPLEVLEAIVDEYVVGMPLHVERGSPAWIAAWEGLSQSERIDGWQYMGGYLTNDGQIHQFRHREHPVTMSRGYRDIRTARLDTVVLKEMAA